MKYNSSLTSIILGGSSDRLGSRLSGDPPLEDKGSYLIKDREASVD
jgi:hypothetical protein